MIVVTYNTTTGQATLFDSQLPSEPPPEGFAIYALPVHFTTLRGYVWDTTTRTLRLPVENERPEMDYSEFIRRLKNRELTSLEAAMGADSGNLRFKLRGMMRELEALQGHVDVRERRFQSIVEQLVDVFVEAGEVEEAERADRIDRLTRPVRNPNR